MHATLEPIHCHVGIISRGNESSNPIETSVVVASNYIRRNGSYSSKPGLVSHDVILPPHAPKEFTDPDVLWNSVERFEKGKKAQLARHFDFHIPLEINPTDRERFIREYAFEHFVRRGMCVEYACHDIGDRNPHVHFLTTMRPLDANGNWMPKQRKTYILDEIGRRIYDPVKRQYKCGASIKTTDWDNPENVEKWRVAWAAACNRELARIGSTKRVTHLSYERQGAPLAASKRLNRWEAQQEQRGIRTVRGDENRIIRFKNKVYLLGVRVCQLLSFVLRACERVYERLQGVGRNIPREYHRVRERALKLLHDIGWREERSHQHACATIIEHVRNQQYDYGYPLLHTEMLAPLLSGAPKERNRQHIRDLDIELSM